MTESEEFLPDWASPPGDTISDLLENRNMTVLEFSQAMGYPLNAIEHLLAGRLPLTERIANRLAEVLGLNPAFWIKRESQYREDLLRMLRRAENTGP